MPTIALQLDHAFRAAITAAFGFDSDPQVGPAQNEKFGDYQANAAMGLAKLVAEKTGQKTNPRAVAEQIKANLKLGDIASEVSIAGPGFINVKLAGWLNGQLQAVAADDRLGIEKRPNPQTVVVDYSGPNVAKQMHVGHLRSTIIGDAISRVLEFEGDRVIRQNHIGDWGTQFGKVVLALWYAAMAQHSARRDDLDQLAEKMAEATKAGEPAAQAQIVHDLADLHREFIQQDPKGDKIFRPYLEALQLDLPSLESLYQFVGAAVESPQAKLETISHPIHGDRTLAEIPRLTTTFIQDDQNPGNEQERLAWQKARDVTLETCQGLYDRLGVLLKREDVRGESFYNPFLSAVVNELKQSGIAIDSEGAIAVFIDGPDKSPLIIRKSDGGYLYGTTDLAAIRFRIEKLHAHRIVYTHDSRQAQHFAQVFATARKAGWAREVSLEYAPFGTMLGEDGKPFKTRSGGTVKLKDLLDEAEERAYQLVTNKSPELPEEQRRHIARAIGIGAVKYSDLSKDRTSDYMFSWDKMLAMDGNTGPYLQYAYARIRSIFRKTDTKPNPAAIALESPFELTLAKHVLRLADVLDLVSRELKPHHLCSYLYELATKFSSFYENCPVLKSDEPTRASRLALCDVTARTMAQGLELLGIGHPEQM